MTDGADGAAGIAADLVLKRVAATGSTTLVVVGTLGYASLAAGWYQVMRHTSLGHVAVVYSAANVVILVAVGVLVALAAVVVAS